MDFCVSELTELNKLKELKLTLSIYILISVTTVYSGFVNIFQAQKTIKLLLLTAVAGPISFCDITD